MSPKPKPFVISGPFDVRHVGGVGIPGVTNPIAASNNQPSIQAQRSPLQRSNTTINTSGYISIQPDLIPTHSFAATGKEEITRPKRANTIAGAFTRVGPSLRLKTSVARLRARSSSNSPDSHRRKDVTSTPQDSLPENTKEDSDKENAEAHLHDVSTASLRTKNSMTRLRERAMSNPTGPVHAHAHAYAQAPRRLEERTIIPETVAITVPIVLDVASQENQLLPLRLRDEVAKVQSPMNTTMVALPDYSHRQQQQVQQAQATRPGPPAKPQSYSLHQTQVQLPKRSQSQSQSQQSRRPPPQPQYHASTYSSALPHPPPSRQPSQMQIHSRPAPAHYTPPSPPKTLIKSPPQQTLPSLPPKPPSKQHVQTRPKRADSGTAIDIGYVRSEERPVGFKDILAVKSFEERMQLYKRTREYWAHTSHGLDEWVVGAGRGRPMVSS
ncbi:hypothetical protein K504DRAFT_465038 [Pleomassaria siparia CBS 279.74]|uniref:Uncharacterized protein n=1 Tax=Pleomassaria siparia CBS 279.74 TaxID=1314801 RepID=A0A6G1KEL3_9PLEO|nr:hypothetical protein K504DRAFT_465038 [Pleomassaria siparia CBS 279.74]